MMVLMWLFMFLITIFGIYCWKKGCSTKRNGFFA